MNLLKQLSLDNLINMVAVSYTHLDVYKRQVMTCAAMMNIPHDIIEAAAIDGASKTQTFWRVVLPLLMPTVLTGSAINLIGGFKAFDIIYVMTQGLSLIHI